jgi:hypothetical protein
LIDEETGLYYTGWPAKGRSNTYHYYTLRMYLDNWKSKTRNIPYEGLNQAFASFLTTFSIDNGSFELFETIMKDAYKKRDIIKQSSYKDFWKRIAEIDKDIEKISDKLLNANNPTIGEIYEKKIIVLAEEKEVLQIKLNSSEEEVNIENLISNTKTLLLNPRSIRDKWDIKFRKMLIWILFNDKIYYNEKNGFQTAEIPLIHKDFSTNGASIIWDLEMTGIEPVSKRHK